MLYKGVELKLVRGGVDISLLVVMSPSMFSSSNGVYYVLIYLPMCLNLCTLLTDNRIKWWLETIVYTPSLFQIKDSKP